MYSIIKYSNKTPTNLLLAMARPVQFDKNEVLANASATFWQMGYAATTISDLVEATQLKPGSIYAAFDSKEGLFIEVLDFYGQQSVSRVWQCLNQGPNPLDGIKNFLDSLVDEIQEDNQQRGCLLVNTILEVVPHNEKVKQKVTQYINALEACFNNALGSAQKNRFLPADKDPAKLAKSLMVTIWGIRVQQRITNDKAAVKIIIEQWLKLLES